MFLVLAATTVASAVSVIWIDPRHTDYRTARGLGEGEGDGMSAWPPLAASIAGALAIGPVQVLDGVGAGLLGVAVPGLVARILNGTGHVNAGLGAVMTMQGIGASLSPALGGFIAGKPGYAAAFLALGSIAVIALALWIVARPVTAEACSGAPASLKRAGAG